MIRTNDVIMRHQENAETTHLISGDRRDLSGRADKSQSKMYDCLPAHSKDGPDGTIGKLDNSWVNPIISAAAHQSNRAVLIQELTNNPPQDRFHLVIIIMTIYGIAFLIPWNMFINAKDYFENYKLDAGNQSSVELLDYKTNFMSYIGMASQYPSFIMNLINLFVQCKRNTLGLRVLTGFSTMILMFVFVVALAIVDTSSWPELFFWITMVTAVVINAASGITQNSSFGIAALLPMKYTNAMVFGNNIAGTLVAVTNLIVLALSPSKKTAAIYYFVVAIIILVISVGAYFVNLRCKFYRHYQKLNELTSKEHEENMDKAEHTSSGRLSSYWKVFKQIYHLLFGVWFIFTITLGLFPAVVSDIKPVSVELSDEYWIAIFCFLFYSVFATLGNLAAMFIRWPNARWVNVVVILRLCFVPLFIFGNFRPALRTLPVYLPYDSVFIISAILFAFSTGYCCSLVMMYAPRCVAPNDSSTAGMMMTVSLVFGVLCGVNVSRVWGVVVGSG